MKMSTENVRNVRSFALVSRNQDGTTTVVTRFRVKRCDGRPDTTSVLTALTDCHYFAQSLKVKGIPLDVHSYEILPSFARGTHEAR